MAKRFFSIVILVFWACKRGPELNKEVTLYYGGPCQTCPIERIDTLLRKLPGVITLVIDSAEQKIHLGIDSTLIKRATIVELLNDWGYDVDDDIALFVEFRSPCCEADELLESSIMEEVSLFQKGTQKDTTTAQTAQDPLTTLEEDPLLSLESEENAEAMAEDLLESELNLEATLEAELNLDEELESELDLDFDLDEELDLDNLGEDLDL